MFSTYDFVDILDQCNDIRHCVRLYKIIVQEQKALVG